jgi:diguanylate cyclase (GGDEF)-like protein
MRENQFKGHSSSQDQRFETESKEGFIRKIEELETANNELAAENERLEKTNKELTEENGKLAAENVHLEEIATKDPLTGAYNRRGFEEETNHITPEVRQDNRRNAPEHKVNAVLILDIDNFKKINDAYGHKAGDEILRQAVKFFKENTRKTDIICRWGGEEFVIVLQNINAKQVIQKFYNKEEEQAQIRFLATVDGKEIPITFSGGTAEIAQGETIDIEKIVASADEQLYRAKRDGKNRIYRPDEKKL